MKPHANGYVNGHANGAAAYAPPPVAEAPRESGELAGVLSPSQVKTFVSCQAKWWFKYGLNLPDRADGKLTLGKAVHKAVEENFIQKIETKHDLPVEGVLAVYREAWTELAREASFADNEDPDDLKACGEVCVQKYMDESAPLVQPAAVEMRVAGRIGGVEVQGYVDILDVQGRIIDVKTAAKSPSAGIEPDYRFQVATYAMITPGATGDVRLDTLVKTKTVKLVPLSATITDEDRRFAGLQYPLAQEAMRAGLYMPNRGGMLCSRRNCAFWRECEKEFGGSVKGAEDAL